MGRTPQAVSLWGQSKRELRIAQIVEYARAVGYEFRYELLPHGQDEQEEWTALLRIARKLSKEDLRLLLQIAYVLPGMEPIPRQMLASQIDTLGKSSRSAAAPGAERVEKFAKM